jgi:trimeric autotransporter adhesin
MRTVIRSLASISTILVLSLAASLLAAAATLPSFRIRAVGAMRNARAFAAAIALPTGQVLITGGINGNYSYQSTAELYEPTTQTFTLVGPMKVARGSHTVTLLSDGEVLVAGGTACIAGKCSYLSSVELYNPGTQQFTAAGTMTVARTGHTATLLADGTVLFAGGTNPGVLANAEVYDPVHGTFTAVSNMTSARYLHSATLLNSGKVLITGGRGCADECDDNNASLSAELYDPATHAFTATGSLNEGRILHTSSLLPNGSVLVAGGRSCVGDCEGDRTLQDTEIYDPVAGTFSVGPALLAARAGHKAVMLSNGELLLYGGTACSRRQGCAYLNTGEVLVSGAFTSAGTGPVAGANLVAAALPGSQVLIAGGRVRGTIANGAELFSPN